MSFKPFLAVVMVFRIGCREYSLRFSKGQPYAARVGRAENDSEDAFAFCVLENIPMTETVPLEQAADAYVGMTQGRKCMSTSLKPKRKGIIELQATSTQAKTRDVSVRDSGRDEKIRRRAYEIYRERGEQPGRELGDWLQAERELGRGMFLNPECGSATADIDTPRLLNCHDLGDC